MEGVLHVARGMIVGEIERGEVVVVRLDLRALGHREAEPPEDLDDLVEDPHERVHCPGEDRATWQGQIGPLGLQGLTMLLGLEADQTRRELGLESLLGPVDLLAEARAVGRGHLAESAQERRQLTRAAEHTHAHLLEGRRGSGPGDVRQGPIEDVLDPRVPRHDSQPRWAATFSASFAKAGGSETASSARIFRSSMMPAFLSPAMKTEYESPTCRHAALTRMIQRARARRFFCLRPRYAKAPA